MQAKVRFELDFKHTNRKGESLIHLYMSYGYKEYNPLTKRKKYIPLKISTKCSVSKKDWDTNTHRPKASFLKSKGNSIKYALDKIEKECVTQFELYWNEHSKLPHPSELKNLIEIKLERKIKPSHDVRIVEVIEQIIAENESLPLTANGKIQSKQLQKYDTVKRMLLAYEQGRNCFVTANTLTKEMYFDIWEFSNEKFKENHGHAYGYLANSMAKNATTLRALLKKGDYGNAHLALNLSDKNLLLKEVDAKDAEVYLSEEHLQRIIAANTLRSKEFEHARNYLILCSFTSLRFGDMQLLHECKVENFEANGITFKGFITKIRKGVDTTDKIEVCIPIFKPVNDLLERLNGKFPAFPSNSKMNEVIKKFAKHIGLNDDVPIEKWYYGKNEAVLETVPLHSLMKCHIGRGTFISNLMNLGLQESDFDFITHPERKISTINKYYDKRTSIEKAAKLKSKISSSDYKSDFYL